MSIFPLFKGFISFFLKGILNILFRFKWKYWTGEHKARLTDSDHFITHFKHIKLVELISGTEL